MKKVLITGGHGGIAVAISHQLEIDGGYKIYAPGHSELDVTNWDSIEKAIKNFVPDILINAAGYVVPQSIKKADLKCTKKHIDINLSGLFYCTEIAIKYNPNLEVINIASSAATKIHATWSEYCATKAAVVMATKCWAEDGIFSVAVSPGRTKTKMRKFLYPNEDQRTLMLPEDFAKVVVKAIKHEFPSGAHINVHKEDIPRLLSSHRDK